MPKTYKNNMYDYTVECDSCHDLYHGQIQLKTEREVEVVNQLLYNLFIGGHHLFVDGCPNCGSTDIRITVSNQYYEAQELSDKFKEEDEFDFEPEKGLLSRLSHFWYWLKQCPLFIKDIHEWWDDGTGDRFCFWCGEQHPDNVWIYDSERSFKE